MSNMTSKVDEVIARYNIKVTSQTTEEYRGLCPVHKETNPSWSINKIKGVWYCHSCGEKGGLVKLIMKLDNCDYNTAIEAVYGKQNKYTIDVEHKGEQEKKRVEIISLPDEFERLKAIGDCPKYLINRLKFDTIRHFGIGKCTSGYYQDRVIIPVRSKAKEVGFIARDYGGNAEKKYLFPKGFKTKDFLFNLDGAVSDEVILVEGPFDAMAMHEKGFPNTVCIFGVYMSIRQATMLHKKGIKSVIICLDNDVGAKKNTGLIAAGDISKRFKYLFKSVYIMQLPPKRDPDECTRRELLNAYLYKKVVATKTKFRETYDNVGNTL